MSEKQVTDKLTYDGLFSYFDQMSDANGRIDTTAQWLAEVGMLIVHETDRAQKDLRNCPYCHEKAFAVSPLNESVGVCWKENTLYTLSASVLLKSLKQGK